MEKLHIRTFSSLRGYSLREKNSNSFRFRWNLYWTTLTNILYASVQTSVLVKTLVFSLISLLNNALKILTVLHVILYQICELSMGYTQFRLYSGLVIQSALHSYLAMSLSMCTFASMVIDLNIESWRRLKKWTDRLSDSIQIKDSNNQNPNRRHAGLCFISTSSFSENIFTRHLNKY